MVIFIAWGSWIFLAPEESYTLLTKLIVRGINLLLRATKARKVGAGYWKWELGLGITYLALAVIFLWHPMIPGITIAIWSALAFIILGIFRIAWTIRLKRHMNKQ